ncbi:hypothetical protein C2G38_1978282, partial [Gigaspora rosea]
PPVDKVILRFYADIMEKCWSKNLEDRPTAEELCEKFKEWSDDETKIRELDECVIENNHVMRSNSDMNYYSKLISYSSEDQFVIN